MLGLGNELKVCDVDGELSVGWMAAYRPVACRPHHLALISSLLQGLCFSVHHDGSVEGLLVAFDLDYVTAGLCVLTLDLLEAGDVVLVDIKCKKVYLLLP